jgi:hypothetical protein
VPGVVALVGEQVGELTVHCRTETALQER